MMEYLILTPHYAPDLGPSAPLFTMLCRELANAGHRVTVVSAVPHYPSGKVPQEFRGKFITRTLEDGVNVVRVRVPSVKRSNLLMRAMQFFCYQIGALFACIPKQYDVVFVSNPALWVVLPFGWVVCVKRTPAIFSIYDVYPDVGISLGIFKHRVSIQLVTLLEKFCLRKSTYVRVISKSFLPGLRKLDVPEEKLVLIYDWVDVDLIRPVEKQNGFALEHNLDHKFVVQYAGNIGLSQALDCLLKAAQTLSDDPEIHFALIGEGAARETLIAQAEAMQLKNVSFIPFQPRERLAEVLSSADLSMVSLKKGVGVTALPSKTYSIFASGRPVLASVDEGCETWDLIQRSGAGICIEPENVDELVRAIRYFKENPELRKEMGKKGRAWAEYHHSPVVAAKEIYSLSVRAIEKKRGERAR